MKGISGFTFLRNAHLLYYPIVESIKSILPLIEEMIVVVGEGDKDDNSIALLTSIDSPKIKIIYSTWDIETYKYGTIYAQQTDLAKQHCQCQWLFYLQGDEVVHEEDLVIIKYACDKFLDDREVEGVVFDYLHFFGDYDHFFSDHSWYKREIRIIRNLPEIHSWRDAQSFRWIPNFDGKNYHQIKNTRMLNCISIPARIFHYGWVRPPHIMKQKNISASSYYNFFIDANDPYYENFDFGRMDKCNVFDDSHPAVMKERIICLDWQPLLRHSGPIAINRPLMKHEKCKYRFINFIEKYIFGGRVIGGFHNYKIIRNRDPYAKK